MGGHRTGRGLTRGTWGLQVVVDFMATWCPPCKLTAPVYEQFSTKYLNLVFTKIDVDDVGVGATRARLARRCPVMWRTAHPCLFVYGLCV